MKNMNILVTLDSAYIYPLKTMLKSLFFHNSGSDFTIYMLHSSITDAEISDLDTFISSRGAKFEPMRIDASRFEYAPINSYYSIEMYFRLLAFELLPKSVSRILYLDPDLLVINPISDLYNTDLDGNIFAAAEHTPLSIIVDPINILRFGDDDYFNSGVLLMDLEMQRQEISENEIFESIEDRKDSLIFPDQDILNIVYYKRILPLDDSIYNFDARKSTIYKSLSQGEKTIDWVMKNTVLLHFCGKQKPWLIDAKGPFTALYKHYELHI